MQISADSKTVLIENPLTGNGSFAKALALETVPDVPKWATPDEVRQTDAWKNAKERIILVRDPVDRFESGATLAFSHPESVPEEFEAFRALIDATDEESSAEQRGAAVLRFMDGGGEVPEYLRPQTLWLKSHFHTVLATHDIAAYFNVEGKVCCVRSGSNVNAPGAIRVKAAGETTRPLFAEVFKDDVALFSKLRVWGSDPKAVRLLTGYCVECANKAKGAPEVVDLSETVEEDGDDKKNPQRKRTRKQVDSPKDVK